MNQLDRADYAALIEARVREPHSLQTALKGRRRRDLVGPDGNLLIVAVDHTARGMLAAGSDPLAVADRYTLLDRVMRALKVPGVDGVMASADILEELAWLGALDGVVAIGTMNRGGIIGARWELDDRLTAYDADHIEEYGLDGGKTLVRIEDTDAGVARTLEMVAALSTELTDRKLMNMIEPLPYLIDENGRARLDSSTERLIKVVAIASGLGSSSAYTWLKLPASPDMDKVAGATTMPIVMLGGDPGADAARTFAGWQAAMAEPNVRGLVAGRALVYPEDGDVEGAVSAAAAIVHPTKGASA
ncbi:deoxyribose-phosphate aldolase [Candidatus Nanopelagicales bacterium]|nr:deoxyribose-phosphate aldolase [Candidatus Nanopelagicales bacterium]